jgi:hypothetical protein
MKKIFIITFILSFSLVIFSQNSNGNIEILFDKRYFNEKVNNRCKEWIWEINSIEFTVNNDTVRIPLNNQVFDTIVLYRSEFNKIDTIITKFSNNKNYTITYNDCCNNFDIYLTERWLLYKQNDYQIHRDSLVLNETCQLVFNLQNYFGTELIFGIYGDIYGAYTGGELKNNELITSEVPFLSGYSDFVNYIGIGEIEIINTDTLDEKWYEKEYHIFIEENIEGRFKKEFFKFKCRFFNREIIKVTYDFLTKEKKVEIIGNAP